MKASRIHSSLALFVLATAISGCVPKSTASPANQSEAAALQADPAAPPPTAKYKPVKRTGPAAAMDKSLAAYFADQFTFGVAMEPHYLSDWAKLIPSTFNRMTAENAMKCARIHPAEDKYNYEPADELANFARQNNMVMTGHALVWHQETPPWLVQGTPADVSKKLKAHIDTVVARYADVTDNWDVVNEAISDKADKMYREGDEGSSMFAAMKEQYIADAFKYAAAAVKASGKTIDLYYNDYNLAKADKREKTLKMAKELRAKGVRIDGIGEQAHWNMTWPSPAEIQTMIDDFVKAGFKVKISELDISVYPQDDWDKKVWEAERPFDDALAQAQATRYKEIFEVFVKNAEHITSVTLWGLTDDRTWLDFMPVQGRNNYPLLFNDLDQPKPAYFALFDVQKP